MKNVLWISAILLAFAAGYFTRGVSLTETPDGSSVNTFTKPAVQNPDPTISSQQLNTVAKAAFTDKEKSSAASTASSKNDAFAADQSPTSPSSLPNNNSVSDTQAPAPTENKYPNEISDEEIDKVIPAPFNQSLKNRHGDLREKYKKFADANQQSDWDIHNQNLLSDAILSNPYAKFIEIQSLQCKVNFCEIRLFENKEGSWSLIMAEMRLQDWWDIGPSSSSGNATDIPNKSAIHVLLSRR